MKIQFAADDTWKWNADTSDVRRFSQTTAPHPTSPRPDVASQGEELLVCHTILHASGSLSRKGAKRLAGEGWGGGQVQWPKPQNGVSAGLP